MPPGVGDAAGQGGEFFLPRGRAGPTGGHVANPERAHDPRRDRCEGRAQESPHPALGVEQGKQEGRGGHLPQLPQQPGELRQDRHPRRREPLGDEPQHRPVHAGVADPQQDAGGEGQGKGISEGHDHLCGDHHSGTRDHHHPRPVAIHQHPGGQLRQRIGRELDHHEGGDDADAGAKVVRGLDPEDPEAGALHDCGAVREDADAPHDPGQPPGPCHLVLLSHQARGKCRGSGAVQSGATRRSCVAFWLTWPWGGAFQEALRISVTKTRVAPPLMPACGTPWSP